MDTPFSQSRITLKSTWVDANQFVGLLEQLEPKVNQLFRGNILHPDRFDSHDGENHHLCDGGDDDQLSDCRFRDHPADDCAFGESEIRALEHDPEFPADFGGAGGDGNAGLPLDAMSILVGSIAIGLAVDDTVHFMHNFRRYHLIHGDVRLAVEKTLTPPAGHCCSPPSCFPVDFSFSPSPQ